MVINMKNYGEIEYNYHDYADDQVWITMGINVGIATRYFLINDEKKIENNLAFANIFSNYLKHEYSQKYMIDVDRTVTSITYLSNREMIGEALVSFIKDICKLNLDSAVFEKVKQHLLTLGCFGLVQPKRRFYCPQDGPGGQLCGGDHNVE